MSSKTSIYIRCLKRYGESRALITDKSANANTLKNEVFFKFSDYRLPKYLNNSIEQDHHQIKKRFSKSLVFQSKTSATTTIQGIEGVNDL